MWVLVCMLALNCIIIKELEHVDHMVYELTLWFGRNNVLIDLSYHLVLTVGGVICVFLIICFPGPHIMTLYIYSSSSMPHSSVSLCLCMLA